MPLTDIRNRNLATSPPNSKLTSLIGCPIGNLMLDLLTETYLALVLAYLLLANLLALVLANLLLANLLALVLANLLLANPMALVLANLLTQSRNLLTLLLANPMTLLLADFGNLLPATHPSASKRIPFLAFPPANEPTRPALKSARRRMDRH